MAQDRFTVNIMITRMLCILTPFMERGGQSKEIVLPGLEVVTGGEAEAGGPQPNCLKGDGVAWLVEWCVCVLP